MGPGPAQGARGAARGLRAAGPAHSVKSESMGAGRCAGRCSSSAGWCSSGLAVRCRSASRSPARSRSPRRRSPRARRAGAVAAKASHPTGSLAGGLLIWSFWSNLLSARHGAFSHQPFLGFVGCRRHAADRRAARVGPIATIAMLMPLTLKVDPTGALIMLAGIYYGAAVRRLALPRSSSTCPARSPRW